MIINKKTILRNIIVFLISFILLLIISIFASEVSMDSIWNYGFSYNIENGLIPYKDFNMIVGPFYNMIIALFMKIIGNSLLSFQIINSLIISLFMISIYNRIHKKTILLILFMGILPVIYGYNTFCAFLLIGILLIEESNLKHKNLLIGLLIGCILMTKHNIGIILMLIHLFTVKEKIKAIINILIPVFMILLYLYLNNALLEYINFCYLGTGNFLDNFVIQIAVIIILTTVIILLIKEYIKTKDNKILYLLAFQIINIPIIDGNHFLVGMIPVFYYFLKNNNKKYILHFFKILLSGIVIILIINKFPISIISTSPYKYIPLSANSEDYLQNMGNYVKNNQKDKEVYLFVYNAYYIKMYLNQNPTFFDLINKGNLGKDEKDYLEKIKAKCEKEKCLFILDSRYLKNKPIDQINPIFKDFIINNYNYLETLPSNDRVYVNYEIKPE